MKLTYWYAPCLYDADCYSFVGKTKKEVIAQLESHWNPKAYGPVEKRTIDYTDAFDLFQQLTGEGGGRDWGLKL